MHEETLYSGVPCVRYNAACLHGRGGHDDPVATIAHRGVEVVSLVLLLLMNRECQLLKDLASGTDR
jgi:hypothetical protein